MAHVRHQRLTLRVNEVHLAQVQNGSPALGDGSRRLPALPQLRDPGAAQPAFQPESELIGAVVNRNLQHGLVGDDAR